MAERSVLHVLPHPGGGGETYIDLLDGMPGHRFDRVHLGPGPAPSPALVRGLARAARSARAHDLLHVHGEAAAALCLPLLATRPSVVTLHGLNLARRLSGLRRRAAVLNLRAVVRAADATICVSETEHATLLAMAPSAASSAVVVRNGVRIPAPARERDRTETREHLGLEQSEPVGIWVGSLHDHKDPLAAVRAAERAAVTLLLVGDGPLRSEVERTARQWVRVLGQRGDVPRLLAAADFFVLTSRHEGLALSLLEAMAHGLPAVVTDLPENVEAIGDTGTVVPIGDDAAWGGALRRYAEEDDARRLALGERARRRAADLFSAEAMLDRTRTVYDEVSRPPARSRRS
jgi:glycosyltransferase involved in cell wall biosynthesis